MSTSKFGLGMSGPGVRPFTGGNVTTKGRTGTAFAYNRGIVSTHVRGLTNKDYGNVFPSPFGKARPMHHYRKGSGITQLLALQKEIDTAAAAGNPELEARLKGIDYNVRRAVKSTKNPALLGGLGMISQTITNPGGSSIQANVGVEAGVEAGVEDTNCKSCVGIGIVANLLPQPSLYETPQPASTSRAFCCNQEKNARRRVLPPNTNLPKTYYSDTHGYLYNRCQTFTQRQFDFFVGVASPSVGDLVDKMPFITDAIGRAAKPGSPLAMFNLYVAQCNPNGDVQCGVKENYVNAIGRALLEEGVIDEAQFVELQREGISLSVFLQLLEPMISPTQVAFIEKYLMDKRQSDNLNARNCGRVYYKPKNWQYAQEAAVSSSARLLKLNVDTARATATNTAKVKPTVCQPQTYTGNPFFMAGQFPNKRSCMIRGD